MTRVNKSKDGIIGPKPIVPEPVGEVVLETTMKPLKKMLKPELVELAVNEDIDVEGKTKAQLIIELEKNG